MKSVYLAGPDVFCPESLEIGEQLKEICRANGLEGLYPLDNQAPAFEDPRELAHWIAFANIDLIKKADFVIANLNAFRGYEPDSGTCFEMGMAIALGKPVFAYFEDNRTLVEKVPVDHNNLDEHGTYVENFSLPLNLMLTCTWVSEHRTAAEAIIAASKYQVEKTSLTDQEEVVAKTIFKRYIDIIDGNPSKTIETPDGFTGDKLRRLCQEGHDNAQKYPFDKLNRWIGFTQGVLASYGLIEVEQEREWSRPLLHSLHSTPPASYSA